MPVTGEAFVVVSRRVGATGGGVMSSQQVDIAVVGNGVLGLSIVVEAARRACEARHRGAGPS
jgi:hypothetical protein